jgi:hypothetical protein
LQRQTQLLQVVLAGRPPHRLSSRLNRWQQEPHEDSHDRDHHKQFDQCETQSTTAVSRKASREEREERE